MPSATGPEPARCRNQVLFLMTRPPPSSTLFPYTTLFRSSRKSRRAPRPELRQRGGWAPSCRLRQRRHDRSEEHTFELQSRRDLVCRLLLEKKNQYFQLSALFYV